MTADIHINIQEAYEQAMRILNASDEAHVAENEIEQSTNHLSASWRGISARRAVAACDDRAQETRALWRGMEATASAIRRTAQVVERAASA